MKMSEQCGTNKRVAQHLRLDFWWFRTNVKATVKKQRNGKIEMLGSKKKSLGRRAEARELDELWCTVVKVANERI